MGLGASEWNSYGIKRIVSRFGCAASDDIPNSRLPSHPSSGSTTSSDVTRAPEPRVAHPPESSGEPSENNGPRRPNVSTPLQHWTP